MRRAERMAASSVWALLSSTARLSSGVVARMVDTREACQCASACKLLRWKIGCQTRSLTVALLVEVCQRLSGIQILFACDLRFIDATALVTECAGLGKLGLRRCITLCTGLSKAAHRRVDHVFLIRRHEALHVSLELSRRVTSGALCSLCGLFKLRSAYTVSNSLFSHSKSLLFLRAELSDTRPLISLIRDRGHLLRGSEATGQQILNKWV